MNGHAAAVDQRDTLDVVQTGVRLSPDPDRTILRFFVPGREDVGGGDSRAGPVIERILGLSAAEAAAALARITVEFDQRHPGIAAVFADHAAIVRQRIGESVDIGETHLGLLGAAFSHEYSIEGAALCNPSIVRHPDQGGVAGGTRFVMSVRGIGEGHRSSIGFRTGHVTAAGTVVIDAPGPYPTIGSPSDGLHSRQLVHHKLAELDDDQENAAYVLDSLADRFTVSELEDRLTALAADAGTRRNTELTIAHLRSHAASTYDIEFAPTTLVSERVLWPRSAREAVGMEDARFVEITDAQAPRYCATYTAFDGAGISQHLMTTEDFVTFSMSPLAGAAAAGKGLALFPRQVGGKFVALSRSDRETNSITYSDDMHFWETSRTIQTPEACWEIVQLGNCGSPIETDAGWLVITHGVGPMRVYSLGAILLDLDEPHRVIASTEQPIITPPEHAGYVPNVVYSCGALAVGEHLILPYAIGDRSIAVATMRIDDLIASMRRHLTDADSPSAHERGTTMSDKSPQKPAAKKPSKTLKEKRSTKRDKKKGNSDNA